MEKHVFEITRRCLQRSLSVMLPGPDVVGEPFWALMSIEPDGETNGNYYAVWQEGKRIVPLYPGRKLAQDYLAKTGEHDLAVRGISKEHLRVLLEFQKRGWIQLGVCVPVAASPTGYGVYLPTAEDIERMVKELGYSLDDV
ncbi:hypothetical protein IT084_14300 [Desulfallas sp. Bu1-1]|uniref:hypothetical protein n=1 Tax=Desulfallas sp. Bu1-1 TaxID=2787620 RepID=UPI00189D9F9F|nr:hypothetical protein [Desulfallas sp. Bu1-1]MBF7084138.1 hypothetical protein [Desulfallas sp. Bu1-1]